jgi:membrane-bound metal-dependent hydrolase YbcI (DUF457 family)
MAWRRAVPAAALSVSLLLDLCIHVLAPGYPQVGFFDDPAHLCVGIIVAGALGLRDRRSIAIVVAASVLIDLDHIPLTFGWDIISAGAPRPYTHSLAGLAAIALLGAALTRTPRTGHRIAAGIGCHLWRDLAVGSGVALAWPFSDHAFRVSFVAYVAVLAALAVVATARGAYSFSRSSSTSA